MSQNIYEAMMKINRDKQREEYKKHLSEQSTLPEENMLPSSERNNGMMRSGGETGENPGNSKLMAGGAKTSTGSEIPKAITSTVETEMVSVYKSNSPLLMQGSHTGSLYMSNRNDAFFEDTAHELNTYRNWIPFRLLIPPKILECDEKGKPLKGVGNGTEGVGQGTAYGVKSLFNNVNAVPLYEKVRIANNMPLIDTPYNRIAMRKKSDCTIKELVRASQAGEMGRAMYSYADFMYCKQLGRVTNNYLITLRRFPYPSGDHINFTIPDEAELQKHMPDTGRMVTWLGVSGNEMGNILKYSVKMPFKEMTASLEKQSADTGEGKGILGTILNAADAKNQQQMRDGVLGSNMLNVSKQLGGATHNRHIAKFTENGVADPAYSSSEFGMNAKANKVYGPIDVVKKVYTRSEDDGIVFDHKMSIVFEYEMRSYDGINGKAAFLDLLANILTTTYTMGKFWGGGTMFFGTHQSNLFANLPIFQKGLTFNNLSDRLWQSYTAISEEYGGEGVLDTMKKLASQVVKGFGSALLGGMLNKLGRPQRMGMNSVLSGAPVGLWHVMIGNPKNPIMSMGNMVITNTTIEHTGPLGIDDFPTGLKVTVELTHGKGKDISGIEQLYLMGDNRIYSNMGSALERMYANAKEYKGQTTSETVDVNSPDEVENKKSEAKTKVKKVELQFNAGLVKFFGTNDLQQVVSASKESFYGSGKPTPVPPPPKKKEPAGSTLEEY